MSTYRLKCSCARESSWHDVGVRKAKDRLEYDDERVRATMELILRHYLPHPGEDLTAPVAAEEARMETHIGGIEELEQSWPTPGVVRARRWA